MQNVNISGFYYFEKSDDRSQVLTVDGDKFTLTQVSEGFELTNHLLSLSGKAFSNHCLQTL